MKFNLNHFVRVQLSPVGREILRRNYDDLNCLARGSLAPYKPPKEDDNGWSTWQLWHLMGTFGEHIKFGRNIPFASEIEILVEDRD